MDSYYQFAPLFPVNMPVVVTGRDSRDAKRTAQYVTAQTGLTLSEVDDWFQHHAESTPEQMALEYGRNARRALEGRLLNRALNRTPYGIIFLDAGAFGTADVRRVLGMKAHVVFIERHVKGTSNTAGRMGPIDFVRRLIRVRSAADRAKLSAETVIDAGEREALAVAQIIVRHLKAVDGPHQIHREA